jgi:hypothetical protein
MTPGSIIKLIKNSVRILTSTNITVPFNLFNDSFPEICMASSARPPSKSIEHPFFTDFMESMDWASVAQKAVLVFFIARLRAQFLRELLSVHPNPAPTNCPKF